MVKSVNRERLALILIIGGLIGGILIIVGFFCPWNDPTSPSGLHVARDFGEVGAADLSWVPFLVLAGGNLSLIAGLLVLVTRSRAAAMLMPIGGIIALQGLLLMNSVGSILLGGAEAPGTVGYGIYLIVAGILLTLISLLSLVSLRLPSRKLPSRKLLLIALIALIIGAIAGVAWFMAGAEAPYGVNVSIPPSESEQMGAPDNVLNYSVEVTNTGTEADVYGLEAKDNLGWTLELDNESVELAGGESAVVGLSVTIPTDAEENTKDVITVTATSENTGTTDSASCTATVSAGPLPTLTYDVSYDDGYPSPYTETVTVTAKVVGYESVDGINCKKVAYTPAVDLIRSEEEAGQKEIAIHYTWNWIAREGTDYSGMTMKSYSSLTARGAIDLDSWTTVTYPGPMTMPPTGGYSYSDHTVTYATGAVMDNRISEYTVEVGSETITTSAGEFDCTRLIETTGGLTNTRWWSPEVLSEVKKVNLAGYEGTETWELVSYT